MNACHAQLTIQVKQSDVPKDFVSHNLYFVTQGSASAQDYQDLAQHVSDVFFSGIGFGGPNPWTYYHGRGATIKVYDLADPKPRPIRGEVVYTPGSWENTGLAPREVALCLSYYALRNLPHNRGRVYLGPFRASDMTETPGNAQLQQLQDLAHGLFNIATMGALSWSHAVHSTVTNLTQVVTNWWANDVWDVQHSRAHSESTRIKYP